MQTQNSYVERRLRQFEAAMYAKKCRISHALRDHPHAQAAYEAGYPRRLFVETQLLREALHKEREAYGSTRR